MDHVVYLDKKAKELENLILGEKEMIVRGAMGRKLPYKKVFSGDHLFFIENIGDGLVKAKAIVGDVFNSEKLTKEASMSLVQNHQSKLLLNSNLMKRFAGKRYLTLIKVEKIEVLKPFKIDRSDYGNMDDWLPVEDINTIKYYEI